MIFICTLPRSGHHLLASLLDSTGYIQCMGYTSLFSSHTWKRLTDFPYKQLYYAPDEVVLTAFDNLLKHYHRDVDKPFCMKLFTRDLPILLRYLKLQNIPLTDLKWIWLKRENKIRQAISYRKAKESGVFVKTNEAEIFDENTIGTTPEAITEAFFRFYIQDLQWDTFFATNGIDALSIVYEHIMHETQRVYWMETIFDYLGISYELPLTFSTPFQKTANEWDQIRYERFINPYIKRFLIQDAELNEELLNHYQMEDITFLHHEN